LAINEFVAYLSFSPYLQTGGTLEVKTIAIISFALCGFANFGSGEFGAVSVVSGSIRGETLSLPLQIELLEQDYNTVGSFTAAAL
ncbi:nucleoside transporter C-terminal domain-containing protein, partial [Escherichia coli]|uniref:nucleoside transporter C-terminal domain-containing protein n=1 Tax=Escherichia coli TaxID=562 RepID=UPI002A3701B2